MLTPFRYYDVIAMDSCLTVCCAQRTVKKSFYRDEVWKELQLRKNRPTHTNHYIVHLEFNQRIGKGFWVKGVCTHLCYCSGSKWKILQVYYFHLGLSTSLCPLRKKMSHQNDGLQGVNFRYIIMHSMFLWAHYAPVKRKKKADPWR